MYLVEYCEEYKGYDVDENIKIFKTKAKAEKYAEKLNNELRDFYTHDEDMRLGDYYDVIEVEEE